MADWDRRFIDLADHIAQWSKDPSTKVGAVITDDKNRIISVGYNGVPRGVNETRANESREIKLLRTIHAEENALHFANRDVTGCRMYVTYPPCAHCAAQIIQRGIAGVVYCNDSPMMHQYLDRWVGNITEAGLMFSEAGVVVLSISRSVNAPDH